MAETSGPRPRRSPSPWAAFLAGAALMLLVILLWVAWRGMDFGAGVLRGVVALPARPDLPSPSEPPPEGPHLPRGPLPTPK